MLEQYGRERSILIRVPRGNNMSLNVVPIWVWATREQYSHEISVGPHHLEPPVCSFSVTLRATLLPSLQPAQANLYHWTVQTIICRSHSFAVRCGFLRYVARTVSELHTLPVIICFVFACRMQNSLCLCCLIVEQTVVKCCVSYKT